MTEQHPINSGFDATTTATEVMTGQDLRGKNAIVTGGYSGLGLVTAKALASAGANVIVPGRDMKKAQEALKDSPDLEPDELDLIDPVSIDAFATRFMKREIPLHLLINNAGIMAAPLARDKRGYESHFAINHLGHFQLTARLWPALCNAQGARVVCLSSAAHISRPPNFDDPNFEQREYHPAVAYSQSKTANILFAKELDRRGKEKRVRAFSVHPGAIITDLMRFLTPEQLKAYGMVNEDGAPIINPSKGNKAPEQGAATTLWCATSAQLEGMGGVYCEDCDIAALTPAEDKRLGGLKPWGTNAELASQLWTITEQMTGITFHANSDT